MSAEKQRSFDLDDNEKGTPFSSSAPTRAPTPLKGSSVAEDIDIVPYDELSVAERKAERRFVSNPEG